MLLKEQISDNSNKRINLISLNISLGTYNQVEEWIINAARLNESRTVCCANVHMVIEAKQKSDFAEKVNKADWVTPDGMPLVWAIQTLYGIDQDRIAGMDLAVSLLKRAVIEDISVFFYGSTTEVLNQLCQKCHEQFPKLKIAGTLSPPFRKTTPFEDEETVKQISASGAGLVFVILGCPKQEIWMSKMKGKVPAVMIGLGGALLVLAGYQTRAPQWMQKLGLEWIFRLLQEPKRLFKRYAHTNTLYIWYLSKELLRKKLKI